MKEMELSAIKAWREIRKERVEKMLNHPEARQRAQIEFHNSVNDYNRLVNYVLLGTMFQVMSDWEDKAIAEIEATMPTKCLPVSLS